MGAVAGVAIDDLVRDVMRPTLADLGRATGRQLAGDVPLLLLLGTAAHESRFGELRQNAPGGRPGVARGIYQIEPATALDLDRSWLAYRPEFRVALDRYRAPAPSFEARLAGDLVYQTALARLLYYRAPAPLPAEGDVAGLARYWKAYWNTPAGAGTVERWLADWQALVAPWLGRI
ncbi:hypothetical protein [Thalassobaculum sp.]|uniref:hypothetical protein n=1 Tax=Thalassobaculum sp. TaxID=2022740 RepID=UPI0032ECE5C1